MPTSRTRGERFGRIVAIAAGLLLTLYGVNVARYNLHSYTLVFPLLAIGVGVLMLYLAAFRMDTLSSVGITILVVTMLITPFVGTLIFMAVSQSFTPSVLLDFWFWIPVSAMTLFPLTVPASVLSLVIVYFYVKKKTLPLTKPRWIVDVSILGFILGAIAVLPLLFSAMGFFIAGGADLHSRACLYLSTGPVTGCITGLIIALLTYRRVRLAIEERESLAPQEE